MKLGFTGTREGMTDRQKAALTRMLEVIGAPSEFHHGDCIGADCDAHKLVEQFGLWIVGHPPVNENLRAFRKCDELRGPLPYGVRNAQIVKECDLLIAAPKDPTYRDQNGGTWMTIRIAERGKCPCVILAP